MYSPIFANEYIRIVDFKVNREVEATSRYMAYIDEVCFRNGKRGDVFAWARHHSRALMTEKALAGACHVQLVEGSGVWVDRS